MVGEKWEIAVGRSYDDAWIERAHAFAVRIVRLAGKLPRTPVGFTVAGQLTRSGLSIPYNLEEAQAAQTGPDTLAKTGIARKESAETRRALMVIRDVPLLPPAETPELLALINEAHEWVAMLTSGTKRLQANLERRARHGHIGPPAVGLLRDLLRHAW